MASTSSWSKRDLTMGIALCAALISLAVLQYRWIGQVAEAERGRRDSARQEALVRLVDDFDGELDRLVQVLVENQAPPEDRPQLDPAQTIQAAMDRLDYWKASTQHPQLVKEILDASPDKQSSLPPELAALSKRIEKYRNDRGRMGPGMSLLVDTEVPALAMPMARPSPGVPVTRWMIVELNLAYICDTWLPTLVNRNFGSNFSVMIVRGTDWDLDNHTVLQRNVVYGGKQVPPNTVDARNLLAPAEIPGESARANVFLLNLRAPGRGRRGGGFNGGPPGGWRRPRPARQGWQGFQQG